MLLQIFGKSLLISVAGMLLRLSLLDAVFIFVATDVIQMLVSQKLDWR